MRLMNKQKVIKIRSLENITKRSDLRQPWNFKQFLEFVVPGRKSKFWFYCSNCPIKGLEALPRNAWGKSWTWVTGELFIEEWKQAKAIFSLFMLQGIQHTTTSPSKLYSDFTLQYFPISLSSDSSKFASNFQQRHNDINLWINKTQST